MRDLDTGDLSDRLEKNLQEVMDKYPFVHRVAAQKWIYLQSHGYTSDRRYENGLIIYKRDYPHIWGRIDWWGRVTWGPGE